MCDVCKNPEKTRKRKETLSPTEATDPHIGHMQITSPEGEDDYPVPQVRAVRATLQSRRSGDVRGKPKSRAHCEPSSKNDDSAGVLPRVASTSTVLAPIGVKTNYIGPALLRSRKMGLKRSGSPEIPRDESENLKKPRSEPSAPSGYARHTAQFRVPFKVPFNTVPVDLPATSESVGPTCDKAKLLRETDGTLKEAPIDLLDEDEAHPSSLLCLSDHEIELDVSFSQKIPTEDRKSAYRNIRRALCKVFMHNADRWSKVLPESSVEETRSSVLSTAAKELEFAVHSMSSSQAGYAARSKSAADSVRRLAQDDALALKQGGGAGGASSVSGKVYEDEWDVMTLLRRVCLRVEE
jgi:bloom syndrome protein